MKQKKMTARERRQRAEQRRWWDAHCANLPKKRRKRAQRIAREACQ